MSECTYPAVSKGYKCFREGGGREGVKTLYLWFRFDPRNMRSHGRC